MTEKEYNKYVEEMKKTGKNPLAFELVKDKKYASLKKEKVKSKNSLKSCFYRL